MEQSKQLDTRVQDKDFTSKTNSFTGELMENLGSKERFKFNNILIDRDINGARNILIRAMRDASAYS